MILFHYFLLFFLYRDRWLCFKRPSARNKWGKRKKNVLSIFFYCNKNLNNVMAIYSFLHSCQWKCQFKLGFPRILEILLSFLCNEKIGLLWGVTSLERGNLVLFYYLGVSEIWLDKRVVIVRWEVPYKRGATILYIKLSLLFFIHLLLL